jgi:ADP-ribosylglycohydrolase
MKLNIDEYRDKVLGCWIGKNIGGTLGAPFEWHRQVNQVSFYTQDLHGEPLPNDDLDIQLLWLIALEEKGLDLDAHTLAEYWTLYVTPHWSEYGTAKVNMRAGLMPPLSGTLHNEYKDSCGSFIRSEIWACIAPGNPEIAARYAYQDAILDHGDGEGVYGEIFCAALESAAFVINDLSSLIEIGLSFIPEKCGVARAIQDAVNSHKERKSWVDARDSILRNYRGLTFMNIPHHTSPEDWQKGFGDGQRGWDAPSNLGMLVIGLLYGTDFSQTVCTAVNCGEDTDCTGATAGSIWGILHGAQGIPQDWITPIGHKIKTACLNLGELGYFGNQLPADIDDLSKRTERIARQIMLRYHLDTEFIEDGPTDLKNLSISSFFAQSKTKRLLNSLQGPLFHYDFFDVEVKYENGPLIHPETPTLIKIKITNTYKIQAFLKLHWYKPEGWQVTPSGDCQLFSLPANLGEAEEIEFQVISTENDSTQRAVLEIVIDSRPGVMLVPILLIREY